MASNDVKIVIKATDEATPVIKSLNTVVKQTQVTMDNFSKSTNTLSGYMKEQKREGRLHSFVIGDIKDALGAAGLAMNLMGDSTSGTNNQMKLVTDSMNKGIVAFYGLDAVVGALSKTFKFLGGGIGVAITVIGSLAIAVGDYIKKSEKTSETVEVEISTHDRIIQRYKDSKTALENLSSFKKQLENEDIAQITANIERLKQFITFDENRIKKLIEGHSGSSMMAEGMIKVIQRQVNFNKLQLEQDEESLRIINLTTAAKTKLNSIKDNEAKTKLGNLFAFDVAFMESMNEKIFLTNEANEKISASNKKMFDMDLSKEQIEGLRNYKEEVDKITATLKEYQQVAFTVFQAVGRSMAESLTGDFTSAKATLKGIANMFITLAETALFASSAIAAAKSIATFYTSLIKDGPALLGGFLALESARAVVNSMHTGGTAFVNAPANREVPIMVRGQETIRVNTPEQERRSSGGGIVINFNSPVSDVAFTRNSILKVLKETGLSIESAFINQSNKVSIA